jgi:hypothetical protein
MFKIMFFGVFACCCIHAGTIGLVVPGAHSNYTAQLPPNLVNNTGISLSNLLIQNPQNNFAFTSETDSGPRNLIGYFDPVLPALQAIWTTQATSPYIAPEEPERVYGPPIGPPVIPPVHPPHPPCVGCGEPPVCYHECHPHPPPTEVPEPMSFVLMGAGLVGIAALRRRNN